MIPLGGVLLNDRTTSASRGQSGLKIRVSVVRFVGVAQKLAHDSAVLLLDPGLVVLPPGPRACEFDPLAEAILDQRLVHKLAAVLHSEFCLQS